MTLQRLMVSSGCRSVIDHFASVCNGSRLNVADLISRSQILKTVEWQGVKRMSNFIQWEPKVDFIEHKKSSIGILINLS